jgi:hypothetical protein
MLAAAELILAILKLVERLFVAAKQRKRNAEKDVKVEKANSDPVDFFNDHFNHPSSIKNTQTIDNKTKEVDSNE